MFVLVDKNSGGVYAVKDDGLKERVVQIFSESDDAERYYGHLVANTLKDIVPRYWTMRGFRIERRFGWDTHGVPIEMLVEKKLGLSGPSSINEFGVAKFKEACRYNVLTFTQEW